jgi:hypothetical protein
MQPSQVVAIFCEDIRSEASGQDTIVGTLPDNLKVARPPNEMAMEGAVQMLPKLGLYLRANLDASQPPPKEVSVGLLNTDNKVIGQSSWTQDVINKAFSDAKANSSPLVGLLLKVVVGPLSIPRQGKITATLSVDGSETVAGTLNIILPDSTASAPPAVQPPSAAPAAS